MNIWVSLSGSAVKLVYEFPTAPGEYVTAAAGRPWNNLLEYTFLHDGFKRLSYSISKLQQRPFELRLQRRCGRMQEHLCKNICCSQIYPDCWGRRESCRDELIGRRVWWARNQTSTKYTQLGNSGPASKEPLKCNSGFCLEQQLRFKTRESLTVNFNIIIMYIKEVKKLIDPFHGRHFDLLQLQV